MFSHTHIVRHRWQNSCVECSVWFQVSNDCVVFKRSTVYLDHLIWLFNVCSLEGSFGWIVKVNLFVITCAVVRQPHTSPYIGRHLVYYNGRFPTEQWEGHDIEWVDGVFQDHKCGKISQRCCVYQFKVFDERALRASESVRGSSPYIHQRQTHRVDELYYVSRIENPCRARIYRWDTEASFDDVVSFCCAFSQCPTIKPPQSTSLFCSM